MLPKKVKTIPGYHSLQSSRVLLDTPVLWFCHVWAFTTALDWSVAVPRTRYIKVDLPPPSIPSLASPWPCPLFDVCRRFSIQNVWWKIEHRVKYLRKCCEKFLHFYFCFGTFDSFWRLWFAHILFDLSIYESDSQISLPDAIRTYVLYVKPSSPI